MFESCVFALSQIKSGASTLYSRSRAAFALPKAPSKDALRDSRENLDGTLRKCLHLGHVSWVTDAVFGKAAGELYEARRCGLVRHMAVAVPL